MAFSAVVLSWRRTTNLPRIVANLQPFVDDVLVVHNDADNSISISDVQPEPNGRVLVIVSPFNSYTWGRFALLSLCRHDAILTCDDDNLVHNWQTIVDTFCAGPTRIVAAMSGGHRRHPNHQSKDGVHYVLFGWGAAFDRRWVGPTLRPYLERYGLDEILLRKADWLFSGLLHREHVTIEADYDEMDGSRDKDIALWVRKDHGTLTRIARRRVIELLDSQTQT